MKNILVVNVNWIGDVVFSTPIFKALRKKYPSSKITCMAVPRVKPVLELVPEIDEILVYNEKKYRWNIFKKIRFISQLKKKNFDIAFLIHGSWTRALLIRLAGVSERVGYAKKGRTRYLTQIIVPKENIQHRSDYYLNVIESYGIPVQDRRTYIETNKFADDEVESIFEGMGFPKDEKIAIIHAGGNWDLKRWPVENWAVLADRLWQELSLRVLLTGVPKELELARSISRQAQSSPVVMTGRTNLHQLVSLMKRANVVISADSGPMHLASSIGTNLVVLFGPTKQNITGPRGISQCEMLQHDVGCNKKACYYLDCKDNICMKAITVEEVFQAVKRMIV